MELAMNNGFMELDRNEMMCVDGGKADWLRVGVDIIGASAGAYGGAKAGAAGGAVIGTLVGGPTGTVVGGVIGGVAGGIIGGGSGLIAADLLYTNTMN